MNNDMTNWDNIVAGNELTSAKNKRKNPYIVDKQRKVALQELESEGWEFVSEYSDPKFVKIRREKEFDEQFEDSVWLLFYQMGFSELNKDRHFKMSYDFNRPDFTQQIDIFAADEETVIIVECKSAKELKDVGFKKEIEAFHAQTEGLRKTALKRYPGRKVKFIWAVHNIIMSPKDIQRLKEWDIILFGDSTIQYYQELVKHLGTSARYQLLGNLLANSEIKNMQNTIPAIKGKMGGFDYYEFSIEPEKLLKIGYVLHRSEANKEMMPTYQRIIKKKRLKEVRDFINSGGYFPNSIIISIDTDGKKLQFDSSPLKVDGAISKIGILHLPKRYHSAYIIDGQHRLYGYSDSKYSTTNSIPVVAFVNLDRSEQLKLFMDINENQKSVSKSLRTILSSDMLWDSQAFNDRRDAVCSKIAQMFGEEQTSPLLGRIILGEDEQSATRCITVPAIQKALQRCQFLSTYNKDNSISNLGSFDLGENQKSIDLLYPFLEGCLKVIKSKCELEWSLGEQGILTINRGIQAVIRIINDIVILLQAQEKLYPQKQNLDTMIAETEYYLEPLMAYVNNIDDTQRKELRGFLGGGGDNKFWRNFQKVIFESRSDFKPVGLSEYIENETKQYNTVSNDYLMTIEGFLRELIVTSLKTHLGDNWLRGVPKPTYKAARSIADEKNYNLSENGENGDIEWWDCISFEDCYNIVTYSSNWRDIFEGLITRPEGLSLSTKEQKTEWIKLLSKEKNKLSKPSYSVSKSSFEIISSIYKWLTQETNYA